MANQASEQPNMGSVLLVDDREKQPPPAHTVDYLKNKGIPAEIRRMDVADFEWEDSNGGIVLVTRKATDLFDSMYSNHLAEELSACARMVTEYGKGSVWFLLDGIYVPTMTGNIGVYTTTGNSEWLHLKTERAGSPRMIQALQASLFAIGVGVITTTHVPSTLQTLYERSQKVDKDGNWPSTIRRGIQKPLLRWHSDDSKIARLMSLWPRLAERPAALLIDTYKSIPAVMAASDKELLALPGIGKTGVAKFREVLS